MGARRSRVARGLRRAILVLFTLLVLGGLIATRWGSAQAGVNTTHLSLTASLWRASLVLSHYSTPEPLVGQRGAFLRYQLNESFAAAPDDGKRWWVWGRFAWRWKLPGSSMQAASSRIVLPLWPAAGLAALAWAALAWRAFRRRLRGRTNVCTVCGYPRAGLPVEAPCPECSASGVAASASSSA